MASAFLATTNILNAGTDDQGSGYTKAAYLAVDPELSQIQADGDTNLNVDPGAWSAAVKGKSTSKVYAKSVALEGAAADTSTSANRCYMVNRVWTPTIHGTAITEAQFRDCYVLSKANGKWSVSSENFIPSGD